MKIVNPSVELWLQGDDKVKHVAKCARVCYGKESGNDEALYKNLEKNNHLSMFRHETYYAAIPTKHDLVYNAICGYFHNPYIKYITYGDYCYVVTNGNFMMDIMKHNPVLYAYINKYQISFEEIKQIKPIWDKYLRYTFCVVTQISTSRELNRVSPNNISEQSTRYVYEDGTICQPYWLKEYGVYENLHGKYFIYKNCKEDDDIHRKAAVYVSQCNSAFIAYKYLVDAGMHRQDARGILPLDTATKCVYTYSIEEWRHIIDLRYYGTTGKPHPNAKVIAGMIRNELINLGYKFR